MALHSKKGSYGIPEDAVQLQRDDAIAFMRDILQNWKEARDVFFFKYGCGILGSLAAFNGFYFNSHYRNRVRLQNFARFSTYLPVVVIPSFGAFLLHHKRVQEPLIINEIACSVCLEIRATTLQLICGVLYPMVLSPVSSFMMAIRYHTYNVPYLTHDPKSVWLLYKKFTKPISQTTCLIAGFNILAAGFITYKEAQSVLTVSTKLIELEQAHETTLL